MFMIGESLFRIGSSFKKWYSKEMALEKARKERLEKQEQEENSKYNYQPINRK